jgi:hypothetical protein
MCRFLVEVVVSGASRDFNYSASSYPPSSSLIKLLTILKAS